MPNTDHYVLKRSGWLLLLFFTHFSATCLRAGLENTFLVADFENYPPSSKMRDHELYGYYCRRQSQKWEERAKTEGIKTPFGTVLFKDEDEDDRMAAAVVSGTVGSFFAIGCAGLWKTRGVWGWWVVPTGLGLWAAFFADLDWVKAKILDKVLDKLEELGILDDDEEDDDEEDEWEDVVEEEENDEEDDWEDVEEEEEEEDIIPLLWIND
ncbi:hypothetical protein BELL_0025g00110 [Botrytis elliptica]|uniref:Uncharacterized protein n=1 Tax=Botrytis elliptica TaxID=278938 RepID=A0A4Z1K1L9_9HELO|nr:hypothetical protein BELL_0025g00110 [Botrytis elliptica]